MQTWVAVNYRGFTAHFAPGWDVGHRRVKGHIGLANRAGMDHWRQKFLPLRFLPGNQRFRHQTRKKPYTEIKKVLARTGFAIVNGQRIEERVQRGGEVNLVRSGVTERLARGSFAIASYPTRATLRIRAKTAVARRPKPGKPNLPAEIKYTPPSEVTEVRLVISDDFINRLKTDQFFLTRRL